MLQQDGSQPFNGSAIDKAALSPDDLEISMIGSWFLMHSPLPFLTLILAYLYVVLKFGPENMKNRNAMNIKYLVMAYNVLQIIINAKLFLKILLTPGSIEYFTYHSCQPLDIVKNPVRLEILEGMHLYLISKVLDLADTMFFILKKKQSHVTFLHVYHHTLMATVVWTYLKYFRGEEGVIIGFLNSFVHVVMYSYYFLAALGPEVQKYLWWKKYITKLQLVQFALVLLWMCSMVFYSCYLSNFVLYLAVGNSILFIYLFTDFYIKAYCNKTEKNSSDLLNHSKKNR